jgi:hypothetical protein
MPFTMPDAFHEDTHFQIDTGRYLGVGCLELR